MRICHHQSNEGRARSTFDALFGKKT